MVSQLISCQGKDSKTRGTDAPLLLHKSKRYNLTKRYYLLVKLPMLRHIPRLGLYPKQVIVDKTVVFDFKKPKTRTGRIYQCINGNPVTLVMGRRQFSRKDFYENYKRYRYKK